MDGVVVSWQRQESTKRDRRAYFLMKTGITWHKRKGVKHFRFLTLTGVNDGKGFRKNMDALRRWIRRNFGIFEYFAVRTNEGKSGVYHLLCVGKYIKWRTLSDFWKGKTGNFNVSLSKVKDFVYQGFEMTRQKLTANYSRSKGWVPMWVIARWKKFRPNIKKYTDWILNVDISTTSMLYDYVSY